MKLLITGGCGFIGSAVVRHVIRDTDWSVANVDKLTYAGNLESLAEARDSNRHRHFKVDICDRPAIDAVFREVRPDAVPAPRRRKPRRPLDRRARHPSSRPTCAVPTPCSRRRLPTGARSTPRPPRFRFQHISTDEVFGSLGPTGKVHRGHALRSQFALLGEQGRLRPSGARLAPHPRPAGADHQLLQQLRALSLSPRS
jgi:dTDP-glucose 4,6-dehydratase